MPSIKKRKMYWKKLSQVEIKNRVEGALNKNLNYRKTNLLGVPASYLDEEQFYIDAPFLEDAPFLKTFIANPNHIGCHTRTHGESEPFFQGTHALEVEVIKLCAEQIFKGEADAQDGYIAPGGTEANIQALWIYRNYYQKEFGAKPEEIAVVYSKDSHYSMPKGANILNIKSILLNVDDETRAIEMADLDAKIKQAQAEGIKYFIVIQNMSTTMFGSVDDVNAVAAYFVENGLEFKLHIDGAFGGFIYPFANPDSPFTFQNPYIDSFTLDGHKMLQTPYGTGIFIIRKGMMEYVETEEAKYVHGKDFTICGSRSGANAVSIWMTLMNYGSMGWHVRMEQLLDRTSLLCDKLTKMGVEYYRNPFVNIVTIKADYISSAIAKKYHLVADSPENTKWWKIVVMSHVTAGMLDQFVTEMRAERKGIVKG